MLQISSQDNILYISNSNSTYSYGTCIDLDELDLESFLNLLEAVQRACQKRKDI